VRVGFGGRCCSGFKVEVCRYVPYSLRSAVRFWSGQGKSVTSYIVRLVRLMVEALAKDLYCLVKDVTGLTVQYCKIMIPYIQGG
jgi:hypothetical protein